MRTCSTRSCTSPLFISRVCRDCLLHNKMKNENETYLTSSGAPIDELTVASFAQFKGTATKGPVHGATGLRFYVAETQ